MCSGDEQVTASCLESFRYYTNTDDATDGFALPSFIRLAAQHITHESIIVRLAVVRSLTSLMSKPKYFRSAAADVDTLIKGVVSECKTTKIVKEVWGSETVETDVAENNRAAAFGCLTALIDHLEDKIMTNDCMELAAGGCCDKCIDVKITAVKIVRKLTATSSSLLSEFVSKLSADAITSMVAARKLRKADPASFPVFKSYVMQVRDVLNNFKETEPTHAVFVDLEAALDKQRAEFAKSKVPTTKAMTAWVDEFRGLAVAEEAAAGEQ